MTITNTVYSFIIYVLFLAPTIVLTVFAERRLQSNKKVEFAICSMFAIFVPCLLAAMRGEAVGTDIHVYAKHVYDLARATPSFESLLKMNTRFEPGYLAMAYISAHWFGSFNAMLFFTQLLIILPIYVSAFRVRDRIPAWSTMLCFYSFFYLMTFNIMREGISVAFVLLSFVFMLDRKWIWAVLIAILGAMFHSSALLGFALGLFVLLLVRVQNRRVKAVLILAVVIAIPVMLKYWKDIFQLLLALHVIPQKYAFYIRRLTNSYLIGLNRDYLYKMILRCSAFFGAYFFLRKSPFFQNDRLGRFIQTGVFIGLLIYTGVLLIMKSGYGYRISLYLEILLIFWVGGMARGVLGLNFKRMPLKLMVMIGIVVFWFMLAYIWRGMHGTMPFYFQIYPY